MSAFQVPKSKASKDQNRFIFTMPGNDREYSVPLLKFIKPALLLKFDQLSEIAAFASIVDAYLPDVFDQFEDSTQFEVFMEQWKEESGIDLGESEASTDS
ncbi:hypothetical protein [Leifsonia aquatica]|uniref:hypothetical protein n=1 Tax=Leifsonia aquatica TaxID=144185 RepID=UPI00046A991F|nr:hypothetical protein [Leifsonia aquatica]